MIADKDFVDLEWLAITIQRRKRMRTVYLFFISKLYEVGRRKL